MLYSDCCVVSFQLAGLVVLYCIAPPSLAVGHQRAALLTLCPPALPLRAAAHHPQPRISMVDLRLLAAPHRLVVLDVQP